MEQSKNNFKTVRVPAELVEQIEKIGSSYSLSITRLVELMLKKEIREIEEKGWTLKLDKNKDTGEFEINLL